MLVRDGRDEAPKKKSVEARFKDLESAKAVINSDKNKLEAKCKELCVESASLSSVLQLHADRWSAVEEAMTLALHKSNSFHIDAEAPFVEDDHPIALAVAAVADPAAAPHPLSQGASPEPPARRASAAGAPRASPPAPRGGGLEGGHP